MTVSVSCCPFQVFDCSVFNGVTADITLEGNFQHIAFLCHFCAFLSVEPEDGEQTADFAIAGKIDIQPFVIQFIFCEDGFFMPIGEQPP